MGVSLCVCLFVFLTALVAIQCLIKFCVTCLGVQFSSSVEATTSKTGRKMIVLGSIATYQPFPQSALSADFRCTQWRAC